MIDPPRLSVAELEQLYARAHARRLHLERVLPLMRGESPFTLVEDDVHEEAEATASAPDTVRATPPARGHLRLVGTGA
jgi:hypothetical protein